MNKALFIKGLVLSALGLAAAAWAEPLTGTSVYVVNSDQFDPPDYQYRTAKLKEPPAEKRLWDYLSFFAIDLGAESDHEFPAVEAEELRARSRELAQQLIDNARESIGDNYVVTVNSFVNLNNLYKTCSLGRYLGEQMIGELQAAGVDVIDVRKSNSLMIRENLGEYGLSRDMRELSPRFASQAVVVGTYSYAGSQVIVNARVLRNSDGMVLSHANLAFALDGLTARLLKDEAMPPRRGGMVSVEAVN